MSVVIVTYRPDPVFLLRCLSSIECPGNLVVEIVIVDNATDGTTRSLVTSWLATEARPNLAVRLIEYQRNVGYAAGTNRGIRASRGEHVLLLNADAQLMPGAIESLSRQFAAHPDVVGLAPKILLWEFPHVIDSVGVTILRTGVGIQRGLGEPDLGQFDRNEVVGGVSFAAAAIRRSAFDRDAGGLLDERYFMYYEDVAWCLRGVSRDMHFMTAPGAVVYHLHSATARGRGGRGRKERLIHRNLIWTIGKSLPREVVLSTICARFARSAYATVSGREGSGALVGAIDGVVRLPYVLLFPRRGRLTRRQWEGLPAQVERAGFDGVRYRPVASPRALWLALARLDRVRPSPRLHQLVVGLTNGLRLAHPPPGAWAARAVRSAGLAIDASLEWYLAYLEMGDSAPSRRREGTIPLRRRVRWGRRKDRQRA